MLFFFLLFACVSANSFGPKCSFGPIYRNLTDDQRNELKSIFRESFNETKGQIKTQINNFVSTLSSDLQTAIRDAEAKEDERKANLTSQVSQLSSEAQQFYANLTSILDNDSITYAEQKNEIRSLISSTNSSLLNEFRSAGIPFGGNFRSRQFGRGRDRQSSWSNGGSWNQDGNQRANSNGWNRNGQFGGSNNQNPWSQQGGQFGTRGGNPWSGQESGRNGQDNWNQRGGRFGANERDQ
ncbi:hypothetical protein M3Y95_01035800 [Aphelenchoides besseyi]|nr:hypothetical protein M3Y95_01035800 [Aphelenchoides besseyi]